GKSKNPLVDLPLPAAEVVAGVDLVIVSHLHGDHFDQAAQDLLPKNAPLLCSPVDEPALQEKGFTHLIPVQDHVTWQGITVHRTAGRHGTSPKILQMMGQVMGFILQAEGEPTLYWAGDTVWYDEIEAVIARFDPDVIVIHPCGAVWGDGELIVMDAEQAVSVCRAAPLAMVIATHMEALDHATITRDMLRRTAREAGITPEQLRIPQDGDEVGSFK
nr:MBL fold metallo-hydrolase [Ardenticatenaceae bacterium]